MGDFARTLTQLLQLNWRNAFALFVAGSGVLYARKKGLVDDAAELLILFSAIFGIAVLFGIAVDQARVAFKKRRRAQRIQDHRAVVADETAKKNEETARLKREQALGNIDYLHDWELNALYWIYNQPGHRARASINHSGIDGLVKMHLLDAEPAVGKRDWTDATWGLPDYVVEAMRRLFGEPDIKKVERPAPWNRSRI